MSTGSERANCSVSQTPFGSEKPRLLMPEPRSGIKSLGFSPRDGQRERKSYCSVSHTPFGSKKPGLLMPKPPHSDTKNLIFLAEIGIHRERKSYCSVSQTSFGSEKPRLLSPEPRSEIKTLIFRPEMSTGSERITVLSPRTHLAAKNPDF